MTNTSNIATREEAFRALSGERDYQDAMTVNDARPDMIPNLSVGDHILAMEHCLAEARRFWYSGHAPHSDAMNFIRKVGGLAVRCMETHGVAYRPAFNGDKA